MQSKVCIIWISDLCYLQANTWFVHTVLQMFHLFPCHVCIKGWLPNGGEVSIGLSFFFFLQIRLMTDYRHSIVVFIEHLLPLCALRKFRKLTFLCYKKIDKFIRSTVLNVTMYPNSTNGMSLDCCIIECSIYAELPIFN